MRGEKIGMSFKEYALSLNPHYGYRKAVYERDAYKCVECGVDDEKLEVHHIKAVIDGGTDDLENLKLLCFACHLKSHGGYFNKSALDKREPSALKKNKTYYMELEVIELLNEYKKKTGVNQSEAVNRILKEYFL